MTDIYTKAQSIANTLLARFAQGTIVLQRATNAASDVATPWVLGAETVTEYTILGTVSGVSKKYIDGTRVVDSDLQIVLGSKLVNSSGVLVEIEPNMRDRIVLDDSPKEIKKIVRNPAAGTVVSWVLVVSG
jgi:hypothetical protein